MYPSPYGHIPTINDDPPPTLNNNDALEDDDDANYFNFGAKKNNGKKQKQQQLPHHTKPPARKPPHHLPPAAHLGNHQQHTPSDDEHTLPGPRKSSSLSSTVNGNGPSPMLPLPKGTATAPKRRPPPAPKPGECQFCGLADRDFYDHSLLVQHFTSECPMLCTCPLCQLPVEIREVHCHLAYDCEFKDMVKQCPRCLETVRKEEYDKHVSKKECTMFSDHTLVCPLCHARMANGDAFWEVHVMTPPFCPCNPRTAGDGDGP